MSFPQTSVTSIFPTAFIGMDPDSSDVGDNYIARVSGETTLQIPWGVVVMQGTNDDQAINLTGQSVVLLGVVPYQPAQIAHELSQVADSNGNIGLLPNTGFRIKRRGRLWVPIEQDVSPTAAVKVRTANLSAGVGPGTFRTGASASITVDVSKFARWVSTSTAALGYGLLEFDFTMQATKTSD